MSLKILSFSEFINKDYPVNEAIIDGLIHRTELIILSAKAKSYKSFLTTEMALCVSGGTPFLGSFETFKRPTLLVQTEVSEAALKERIETLLEDRVIENLFIAEAVRLRIDKSEGLQSIREAILENKIELLILDPFYTLHGGDENSASEVSRILTELKKLILELNIGCILVHHQGKKFEHSEGKQAGQKHRGSSSFADVPDGSISLSKIDEQTIALSSEFRNRESLQPFNIKFIDQKFSVGDSDIKKPDRITTAIIEILEDNKGRATRGKFNDQLKQVKGITTSMRTVDGRLKRLISDGTIIKVNPTTYELQNCNPL